MVGERLPVGQTVRRPERVVQRLGGDHERVDGDDVTPVSVQGARVALGRPDDGAGPHRAPGRGDDAGADGGHLGVLDDPDAPALDGLGQAPDEPCGVDGGAVRGEGAAQHVGGTHPGRGLCRGEERQVGLTDPPGPGLGHLGVGAGQLGRGPGEHDGPALMESALDPLGRHDPADLADGGLHGQALGASRAVTAAVVQGPLGHAEQGRAPAAVAARRTEPGDVALDDGDRQVGIGLRQVVRRPQPGEPAAHDGDVHLGVAVERRTDVQRTREPVPPQGEAPVALARRRGQICFHASVRTARRRSVM